MLRNKEKSMIGGVCSGIAKSYNFDLSLVRLVVLVLFLITGSFILIAYLAAWLIIDIDEKLIKKNNKER